MAFDLTYLQHEFEYLGTNPWIAGGWTVNGVRQAIEAHDGGMFCHSASAATKATQFPPIFGALLQRIGPPLGLGRAVRGGDSSNLGEEVRKGLERTFTATLTPGLLGRIFVSIAMMGVSVIQNIWSPTADGSLLDVRLKPVPMGSVIFDSTRQVYRVQTREGLVDANDGDGHWEVITPWGEEGHPSHLMGAIRPVGLTWMKGSYADSDEASYSDVHGRPKPVGRLPKGVAPNSAEGKEFGGFLRGLSQPRSGGMYPDGAEVRLLEAVAKTEAVFEQIMARSGKWVAFALVGQDGTLEKGTGVYTAPVFEGVKFALTRAETRAAGTSLTRGVARPWTLLNYGREELTGSLEWLLPDLEADARHKSYSERLEAYHRIVKEEKANGFVVDQQRASQIAAALGVEAPRLADTTPTGGEIFAYDLESGIVLRNEQRARKGLDPLPDGDETVPEFRARIGGGPATSGGN